MSNQPLFWMILGIACLVGIVLLLRSPGPLPHNAFYNPISAADAINSLRQAPETDVVFAVARGFWDEGSHFDSVYAAYEKHFEKRCSEITAILAAPTFDGHWMQESYPLFAIGERVAVWGGGDDTLYLRIITKTRRWALRSLCSRHAHPTRITSPSHPTKG